jgi:hypothetical protein
VAGGLEPISRVPDLGDLELDAELLRDELPAGLQMRELAVVALARGNHEIVVGGLHASRTVLERPILDEVVNGLRMKRVFVHAELRRPRGWIPR